MKSRNLINLLLLAMILALGAVAYLKPGLEEPEAETITDLAVSDIDRIALTTTTDSIHFIKQADDWWLAGEPMRLADTLQIEQLTDIARTLPARSYQANELSPEKLGLTDNSPSLTLNNIQLIIGDTDPLNSLRYIRKDDQIFLIRDSLLNYLQASPNQFISRKLFPSNTSIRHIDIPGFDELPADDRNQLLQYWVMAQAVWVSRYKAASAWEQVVTVTLADETSIEYQLRHDEDDLVLGRSDWGVEYHMGSEAAERLLTTTPTD